MYVWVNQEVQHINAFISEFKQRMKNVSISDWFTSIDKISKLQNYKIFKHRFETEVYINSLQINKIRRTYANFRCGTVPLEIETGRMNGIERKDRFCIVCKSREKETTCRLENNILMSQQPPNNTSLF